MILLTPELEARFAEVGSQENVKDPIVIAKFFNPQGAGTWYATEWHPEDQLFFGYVSIFGDDCDEWGYFSIQDLVEYTGPLGLKIERDLHCGEQTISTHDNKAMRYR